MNKNFFTRISKSLFIVVWLLVSSCGPTAQPETEPQPEEAAQPVEEPAEFLPDTFHVRVIQYDMGASEDRFVLIQEAADRIGAEMGLSIDVEVITLAANPDSCNAAAIMFSNGTDLYMQDSICASHAFAANRYASVPDDLVATLNFFGAGKSAFSDPAGNWWAAPFGTSPMMLIYNPGILGELPEAPMLSDVIERGNEFPLIFPPHGGIAMTMVQSYQTDPFTELSLLNPDFYGNLNDLAEIVDGMATAGQIRSASTQEILPGFMSGEIAWTAHDLMFLRMLKMEGYEGPLAVATLPQINRFGGSAMGIAWVVPGESENPELAWQVVSRFAADPQAIEWLVSNGFVPFYELGYQELASQRGALGGAWLPADVLENDRNFEILRGLANMSTAWTLPATVPVDVYNERILPIGSDLIGGMANGQISMVEGLAAWETFLREVGVLR